MKKKLEIIFYVVVIVALVISMIGIAIQARFKIKQQNVKPIPYTHIENCQHNYQPYSKYNWFMDFYETEFICINCGLEK